jgi:hypothetical protein
MVAVWRILSLMIGKFYLSWLLHSLFVVFGVLTFLHVFQRIAFARLEPSVLA